MALSENRAYPYIAILTGNIKHSDGIGGSLFSDNPAKIYYFLWKVNGFLEVDIPRWVSNLYPIFISQFPFTKKLNGTFQEDLQTSVSFCRGTW
jgi:hypothetical protein